ncbi:MAG: DUF695 domain-containing protein [Pseudoflavonifractor sp.]|nr:DUF695 domain-containing protein [Pseudoflavonifractor sp.]
MKISSDWWTSPTESESGRLIMVTGRRGLENVIASGKYDVRVEITWRYQGDRTGMPDMPTSTLMEAVNDALEQTFKKDPVAIVTGIYTGDDERNWILYTKNQHIFNRRLNEALAPFDLLPITIYAENDPDWNEYREMCDLAEVMDGE